MFVDTLVPFLKCETNLTSLFCFRGNFSSANAMYSALNQLDEDATEGESDSVVPSASKPGNY